MLSVINLFYFKIIKDVRQRVIIFLFIQREYNISKKSKRLFGFIDEQKKGVKKWLTGRAGMSSNIL